MYHYVYQITHIETGSFYIGSRSSKIHPTLDSYMGSMAVWKPDKSKLTKSILKMDFETRQEAFEYEIELIELNIKNPMNENYHIPHKGFSSYGKTNQKNSKGEIFFVSVDDPRIKSGEFVGLRKSIKHTEESIIKIKNSLPDVHGENNPFFDKKHSDKSREKMSESAKVRKIVPENEAIRRDSISKTLKSLDIKRSSEFKENLSKARMGENNPYSKYLRDNNLVNPTKGKKYDKAECPHCNRMISISIIHVAHLDNCKYNING
jgi:hypothetical protein